MPLHSFKLVVLALLLLVLSSITYLACQDLDPTVGFEQLDGGPHITWDPDSGHHEPSNCGPNIGEEACNYKLLDHNGDEWQLYDHWGEIVVLDFSTMWCAPCQASATDMQLLQDFYAEHDVQFVTVMLQDFQGQRPSEAAMGQWFDAFHFETVIVVAGDDTIEDPTNEYGFHIQVLPTLVIVDRDRRIIYKMEGWNLFRLLDQLDILTST
tara:strand:+ start:2672 stop:3301 length:630 start_codon:yes stop_codon:yes gene_type:complete